MAEAHAAVAFSFTVDHEGFDVQVNHDALWAIWYSGIHSWKKRIARWKNNIHNGVYPASPASLLMLLSVVIGLLLAGIDPSMGMMQYLQTSLPYVKNLDVSMSRYAAVFVFSLLLWITVILFLKYSLKALLCYTAWMYEPRGRMSLRTKIWLGLTKLFGSRRPLLYSYQGSLPQLPVPALKDTMNRYLLSVRPLMDDNEYQKMEKLVDDFKQGIGPKLQRYLILKSWWSTNYVSDWWEDYVYLHGRAPIMVNSNYYGIDSLTTQKTERPCARAANVAYAILQYRRTIDRETMEPILLNNTVPLCSWQYERQFNTTRIPGIEKDTLMHLKDSKHIAVYHKGRWFKVYIHYKNKLLSPAQLEMSLEKVLSDTSEPAEGESHLAALTAGNRIPWAKTREEFFKKGVNKASLDAIEKAAFVLVFDDESQDIDKNDASSLSVFGRSMLHGKGYDRWFDKSFSLVVTKNARIGFNAEHSWADAPIMAHLWESIMIDDLIAQGYSEDGHVINYDKPEFQPPNPIKLQWEIPAECQTKIEESLQVATDLLNDVDLNLIMHDAFGKGLMKKCKMSPDAFIQIALQLAYYRDAGKFCLTYEASMTRLYKEGRTETVRSCTLETCAFVKAMEDKNITNEERIRLAHIAAERHQQGYRDAMTGRGIDRHLFCLYVVSKYLNIESPFLKKVLSEPWKLSTSQTPHQQTSKADVANHPELISAGGGFGPVADDGYGVSYIIAGEDIIFFHVSSKRSSPLTDSTRFAGKIKQALADMRDLFMSVKK